MKLRQYQQEAVDAVFRYLSGGGRAPLVEIPTGGGKSPVLGEIARRVCEMGGRVLVATHRKELVVQDAEAIRRMWPGGHVGVYSAGLGMRQIAQCTVAGAQSIYRRTDRLGRIDVVIIDEAHLVSVRGGTQYTRLLEGLREHNDDLVVVGLTATPYRLGQGMLTHGEGAIFKSIVYRAGIRQLVDEGYLSPIVSAQASAEIDTSSVRTERGDFVLAELEAVADTDSIVETVADDVLASGRRHVLVFGVSVAHAARLRNALRMRGISTEMVIGETKNRDAILSAFKAGEIGCITSCDVLTTGFDAPLVDGIALVRPTQSTALYVQMVGRGSRLAPGKKDCLLLDYGGNIARHGPLDEIQPREKRKVSADAPTKECPTCNAEVLAGMRLCPECGYEFPPPVKTFDARAASGEVIGDRRKKMNEITRYDVDQVDYAAHVSKTSGLPMLRVGYFGPASRSKWHPVASEFVCLFHDEGFARSKAEQWWREHCPEAPYPGSADEAVELAQYYGRMVIEVATKPDPKNDKYTRIVAKKFAPERQPGHDDGRDIIRLGHDSLEDIFDGEELPF